MIDSHCHLYDEKLNDIRKELLEKIEENNQICICSADNVENSKKAVDLASKYPFIYATVGTHPHEAENFLDSDLEEYKNLVKNKKVVAIGEIGLDYFYDFSPREKQKEVLIKQIKLANELNLPCVFHVREATGDFLEIVKNYKHLFKNSAVVHSFNGSLETAKILLNCGFYLSFNGIATFKNAKNVLDIINFVPLNKFLLETDSPYLTPVPFRGQVNTPLNVYLVAKKVAEIKNMSVEEVIKQADNNAKTLFKIQN